MYKNNIKTISITMDNTSVLKLLDSKLAEVLLIVLKQVNPTTYQWMSSKGNRKSIEHKLNMSYPTVSRYILMLRDKDILLQGEYAARGEYILNKKIIKL